MCVFRPVLNHSRARDYKGSMKTRVRVSFRNYIYVSMNYPPKTNKRT